MLGNLGYNILL